MAEGTTLLFKPTLATIDSLVLDASITESHVGEVEVTEHPVEAGGNIADHARTKPDKLTIEGLISDTPLSRVEVLRIVQSQGISFTTTSPAAQVAGMPGNSAAAMAVLRDLKDNPRLITVQTGVVTYDDMILTSLNVPRSAASGDALRFTATFTKVKLVTNKTTQQTVTKTPQGKPKASTGKQVGKGGAEGDTRPKSWAKTLTDNTGLSGLMGLP